MNSIYDVIVLGGGTAGLTAAQEVAGRGGRVLLVDSGLPGGKGFCLGPKGILNAVLESPMSEEPGNWVEIKEQGKNWINEFVQQRVNQLENSGGERVQGEGRVMAPGKVQIVEDAGDIRIVEGKAIVLAGGSQVTPIPSIPFDGNSIQKCEEIWGWEELPNSVLFLGSQPDTLEWCFALRRLGVKVFLVHGESELLSEFDPDLLEYCEKILKKEKVKTLLNKKITSVFKGDGELDISLNGGVRFSVEKLIVNSERNVEAGKSLAESIAVDRGHTGEILVDEKLKTTVPGIFAAGSVTGHQRCGYRSREEGMVAAINALGKKKSLHSQLVPRGLQLSEQIASIGCNLEMAHHLGYRGIEGRAGVEDKDPSENPTGSFVKLVFEKKSLEIIGGQALGPNASDIIGVVQMGMRKGMSARDFCQFQGNGESFLEVLRGAALDAQHKVSELR